MLFVVFQKLFVFRNRRLGAAAVGVAERLEEQNRAEIVRGVADLFKVGKYLDRSRVIVVVVKRERGEKLVLTETACVNAREEVQRATTAAQRRSKTGKWQISEG